MKVAVLYICTGIYNQFFEGFYNSAKKYFLSNQAEIKYFVFTDDMNLIHSDDVEIIQHECQGFPMDSLMRFDMFLSIENKLRQYDYAFFFNANMQFVAPVGTEILPDNLAAVIHPGYYNKPAWRYPYERNRKSTAYIAPYGKNYRYYMGSVNGGRTPDYLQLAAICSAHIHEDLEKGIIAVFHDESHLNHYLRKHQCMALPPSYAYIEGKQMAFTPKIIIRDKVRIDPYFDKGRDHSLNGKLKKGFSIVLQSLKWYLNI
jgi:hypothetical protein